MISKMKLVQFISVYLELQGNHFRNHCTRCSFTNYVFTLHSPLSSPLLTSFIFSMRVLHPKITTCFSSKFLARYFSIFFRDQRSLSIKICTRFFWQWQHVFLTLTFNGPTETYLYKAKSYKSQQTARFPSNSLLKPLFCSSNSTFKNTIFFNCMHV